MTVTGITVPRPSSSSNTTKAFWLKNPKPRRCIALGDFLHGVTMAVYTSTSAFLLLPPDPNSKHFPKGQAESCSLLPSHFPKEMKLFQVAGSPVIVQILNLNLSLTSLLNFSPSHQQLQLHLGLLPSNQVEIPYSRPLPISHLAAYSHSGTLHQFLWFGAVTPQQ